METNKANAVYKIKTIASIYLGKDMLEFPVDLNVLEMPWDEGKTPEQLIKDIECSAKVELSIKKKHLVIEKVY